MVRLKVHLTRQTAPLFVAAGCSKTSDKSNRKDYFQCQGESKGSEGQILLSQNDGYYLPMLATADIFLSQGNPVIVVFIVFPLWSCFLMSVALPAGGGTSAPSLNVTRSLLKEEIKHYLTYNPQIPKALQLQCTLSKGECPGTRPRLLRNHHLHLSRFL